MWTALDLPRTLLTYQMQWWSKMGTHILHIEQCFDRAGCTVLAK
jgi:hypothetical protein